MIDESPRAAQVRTAVSLADLMLQAKGLNGEILQSDRNNVKRARDIGKLLAEAKELCQHGEWLEKLAETGVSTSRCSDYMRMAKFPARDICSHESIRDAMKWVAENEPDRETGDDTAHDEAAAMHERVKEKCSAAVRRAVRTNEITVEDAATIASASHEKQDKALDAVRLGKAKTLKDALDKMKPRGGGSYGGGGKGKEEVKDSLGNPVPDRCRDAFADPALKDLIDELENAEALVRAEPWLDRATKLTDHYQFLLLDKFRTHSMDALRSIQLAKEALASGMPYAVCPKCKGEENGKVCRSCRGGGHIPLHRWEELTRETV